MLTKNYLKSILLLLCVIVGGVNPAWSESNVIFEEDFSQFTASNTTALTSLTSGSYGAWSDVENVYKETGYIKFSASKKLGKMTTPALSSLNGKATLTFKLGKYSKNNATLKITINGTEGRIDGESSRTFTTNDLAQNGWTDISVSITGGTPETTITFESTLERFYLDDIIIVSAGPVDLKSFVFKEEAPSVILSKSGDAYEATYTQKVTVEPDSYDGTITYTIDETNSTFGDIENVVIDDETGELFISTSNNVGGIIVVKASGTGTEAYNKPDETTYTLTVNAAPVGVGTPTFSLATGSYYYGTEVEIEAINSTLITYTTDGTEPTMESTTYSVSVPITKTMTLKAKAWDDDLNESEIASVDYTLKAPEVPVFSVNGGEVLQGSTVTLTPGEGGSVIVYTTDGTDPTIDSDLYVEPITINEAMTIKAATVDDGDNLSAIAICNFTVKKAVVYEKVTDASTLAEGDQLLLVCEDFNLALGAIGSTGKFYDGTTITIKTSTISITDEKVAVLSLAGSSEGWTLQSSLDDKYLSLPSSSNELRQADAVSGNNQKWAIDISDGVASVSNLAYTKRTIKYNSGSPRFACYESGQKSLALYRLQENLEDVTITINPSENFTLNNGETKMLTVTASNGADITATSSDEEVATVEKTGDDEYTVTAVKGTAEGSDVTITFSTAKTAIHKAGKNTIVATVKDSRIELNLSFAEESVSVNVGESVAAPALSGNEGNGAVTYASADETIATVDASTGEVTGVADGTTIITATVAEVPGYHGGSVQFTVNVIDPNKKGTKNNPYTVTEAIDAIDNGGEVSGVYVAGIVSQVDYYNNDYKSITYWISEDGTTENQFQVYSGKGIDGADFSSVNDVLVGDVVVVYGDIKKYNSVYEFNFNNELVSLIRKADPELSFDETAFELLPGAEFNAPTLNNPHDLSVTYSSDNDEVATVDATTGAITIGNEEGTAKITATFVGNADYREGSAYYTITVGLYDPQLAINNTELSLNGGVEKAMTDLFTIKSDGTVTYNSADESVATVVDGVLKTLAIGTTTITISVAKTDMYKAGQGEIELTVTALPDVAPLNTTAFVKVTATEDIVDGEYLIVNEDGSVAFDGSLKALDAIGNTIDVDIINDAIAETAKTKASTFTIDVINGTLKTASGSYIGNTTSSNGLNVSGEAALTNTFSIEGGSAVITASGGCTLRYNSASNQRRFRYYKSGQQSIQLYRLQNSEFVVITVGDAGWRTLVASVNVKFPAEVTAYIVTNEDGETAKLKAVKAVEANVPVLLKADKGSYALTIVDDEDCDNTTGNLLKVSEAQTYENVYVLANKSNGVGFYKWTGGWMGAGRVYLPVEPGVGARGFIAFDEEGVTTGISTMQIAHEGTTNDNAVYNLNGQRVSQPAKGLYIVNGKKVFMK